MRLLRACVNAAFIVGWSVPCPAGDTHVIYAPPWKFGNEVPLRAHLGSASYRIKLEPGGNIPTEVIGEVVYEGTDGKEVRQTFRKSIQFRTGNVIAQPKLKLKAVPTGVQVKVIVN